MRNERDNSPESKFVVNDHLLSVDGPDGSGKTALVEILKKRLQERYGEENVVVIQPGKFHESKNAEYFLSKLKDRQDSPFRTNSAYMAAFSANFERVREALQDGKYVILDSGPLRALAFGHLQGELALKSSKRWMQSGRAIKKLLPGYQIYVSASTQDRLINIQSRGERVKVEKVEQTSLSYANARSVFEELTSEYPLVWIDVTNERQPANAKTYLENVVDNQIMPQIS